MDFHRSKRISGRIVAELTAIVLLTLFVGSSLAIALHLPTFFAGLASLLSLALALVVGCCWTLVHPDTRPNDPSTLGPANLVTLIRGSLICIVAAFVPFGDYAMHHAWTVAVLCLIALLMDGVDGAMARRTRSGSAFGARFDMELDAFLMLALCTLLVAQDKVGLWVLTIGLLRYGFMIAGEVIPVLKAPLPENFRRKTVCVWQLVTLMICLLPPVNALPATLMLALALLLLLYSFGKDVAWLISAPGE